MDKKYVAYVGSKGRKGGIHIYDVDVKEGILVERKEVLATNSSHLCCSNNGKYLYSILDDGVGVYKILPDGDLKFINSKDIDGLRGRFLNVDKSGKYLFVGGYHDGKVTLMHTHRDGRLGSIWDGVFHKGIGTVAERNSTPHVTCVIPSPDNHFVCAVDNGLDQVKLYTISEDNKLELADTIRLRRDTAPRRMRFSEDGKNAYILCELSNTIEVYSYSYTEGDRYPVFEKIQTVNTYGGERDPMYDIAAGFCFSPDGKYMFASTAGPNTVAMFSRDPEDGTLKMEFSLPISGEYPKDVSVFPDGRHLAVVNHESNSITTFRIDYEKKTIYLKGKPNDVKAPNCIHIFELPEPEAEA